MEKKIKKSKPKCKKCDRTFPSLAKSRAHMRNCLRKKLFKCKICLCEFNTRKSVYTDHKKTCFKVHFSCHICTRKYGKKTHPHDYEKFEEHYYTHPQSERLLSKLDLEARLYLVQNPITCDVCGQRECSDQALEAHKLAKICEKVLYHGLRHPSFDQELSLEYESKSEKEISEIWMRLGILEKDGCPDDKDTVKEMPVSENDKDDLRVEQLPKDDEKSEKTHDNLAKDVLKAKLFISTTDITEGDENSDNGLGDGNKFQDENNSGVNFNGFLPGNELDVKEDDHHLEDDRHSNDDQHSVDDQDLVDNQHLEDDLHLEGDEHFEVDQQEEDEQLITNEKSFECIGNVDRNALNTSERDLRSDGKNNVKTAEDYLFNRAGKISMVNHKDKTSRSSEDFVNCNQLKSLQKSLENERKANSEKQELIGNLNRKNTKLLEDLIVSKDTIIKLKDQILELKDQIMNISIHTRLQTPNGSVNALKKINIKDEEDIYLTKDLNP